MGGVEPGYTPAPAEAGDAKLIHLTTVAAGEGGRRVEIAHHLIVGHLGDDGVDQSLDVADPGGVALTEIKVWRDGVIAGVGQPANDVLNPRMDAENLLHHEDDRPRSAVGRSGAVGGDSAAVHRDVDPGGVEAGIVGGHGRGGHRAGGQREAGAGGGAHGLTAGELGGAYPVDRLGQSVGHRGTPNRGCSGCASASVCCH